MNFRPNYAVTGTRELTRTLEQLVGPLLLKRGMRSALRSSMKPVLEDARRGAPVRTGRLRGAIALGANRSARKEFPGAINMSVYVRAGKSRADLKGAYYRFVVHSRTPWLANLLENRAKEISANVASELFEAVGRIAAANAKRLARVVS